MGVIARLNADARTAEDADLANGCHYKCYQDLQATLVVGRG